MSPTFAIALLLALAADVDLAIVNGTERALHEWPAAVAIRAMPILTPEEDGPDRGSEISCPIDEADGTRRARCLLWPGPHDLRLQAAGFLPWHHWEIDLPPAGSIHLPSYSLQTGASLVGRVVREDGEAAEGADVVLRPSIGDGNARSALARQMPTMEHRTRVEARGHFQVVGVAPGGYDLVAQLPEHGLATVPRVTLSEPVEHRLDDPVVVPHFPEAMVRVQPPRDVGGHPWTVRLVRPGHAHREAGTDEAGEAAFELLPSGEYFLVVEDGAGQRWIARSQGFSPADPAAAVSIEGVPVIGEVSLAGEPLAAALYFGGRTGSESIRLDSGADGEFVGILPRQGDWTLEVRSDEPQVRWATRRFPVEVDPGLGAAELVVELPGTSITGRVLEPDGRAATAAEVLLQPLFPDGRLTQVTTDGEGRFSLAGQVFGEYLLEALGSGMRASEPSEVVLSESRSVAEVELHLLDSREIAGRVVSGEGVGVPGATIWAVRGPSDPADDFLIPTTHADIEGRFLLRVPAVGSWRGVAVMAPGYVLGLSDLPPAAGDDDTWTIPLRRSPGGELSVSGLAGPSGRTFPAAMLDHVWVLDFGVLSTWARHQGIRTGDGSLTVPNLPPGTYRLCDPASSDASSCRDGFLAAGGHLVIDMGEKP